jgi:hypothetical protein
LLPVPARGQLNEHVLWLLFGFEMVGQMYEFGLIALGWVLGIASVFGFMASLREPIKPPDRPRYIIREIPSGAPQQSASDQSPTGHERIAAPATES